jgi:glc operon protein GlcG
MRREIMTGVMAAILAAGFAAQASAQLAEKKVLTLAEAKKLVAAAESAAAKGDNHVAIAVLDDGGHIVLAERMDGAVLVTTRFAVAKAKTAVMYHAPSAVFADALNKGHLAILRLPEVVPFGGGFPLVADGQLIGAIGCSGGKAPTDDVTICEAGAAALGK